MNIGIKLISLRVIRGKADITFVNECYGVMKDNYPDDKNAFKSVDPLYTGIGLRHNESLPCLYRFLKSKFILDYCSSDRGL